VLKRHRWSELHSSRMGRALLPVARCLLPSERLLLLPLLLQLLLQLVPLPVVDL